MSRIYKILMRAVTAFSAEISVSIRLEQREESDYCKKSDRRQTNSSIFLDPEHLVYEQFKIVPKLELVKTPMGVHSLTWYLTLWSPMGVHSLTWHCGSPMAVHFFT